MPPRSRGHGGGTDDADATPSRPRGAHPRANTVHDCEEGVAEIAQGGRSTADGGTGGGRQAEGPASPRAQTDDLLTQGTGQPGGTPDGHPTAIEGERPEVRRSLELENHGAVVLADQGYRVKQTPSKPEVAQARLATGDTGDPKKKPDFLVEGRVFDCYAPTSPTKPVRGIHWEVENKVVTKKQTQRMVVNLTDWRGDMAALRKQFNDWPIPGLKELKAITPDGDVVQIPLPPGNQ